MSAEFQIFISSTVKDLKYIRKRLAEALEHPGRIIRCSEELEFPVEPDATSHDACLAVVRGCHAFVLLIGKRFGGEYQAQNKSITWREWEEARECGITPIVLVNKKTDKLCQLILARRKELIAAHPGLGEREQDALLEGQLKSELTTYHKAPGLQRFVEDLRKGHKDNWKLDWDGSTSQAIKYVNKSLAVQAASAFRLRIQARDTARAAEVRLGALGDVSARVAVLIGAVRSGKSTRADAVQALAAAVSSARQALFRFKDDDRYTFIIHEVRSGMLHRIARAAHSDIPDRNRVWKIGQGHVGLTAAQNQLMVSGDMRHTEGWVQDARYQAEDTQNYVSVISKPYYSATGGVAGTVTLSSSRVDHFTSSTGPEAKVFDSIVNFVNILTLQE
jgi:hypothetical protein